MRLNTSSFLKQKEEVNINLDKVKSILRKGSSTLSNLDTAKNKELKDISIFDDHAKYEEAK